MNADHANTDHANKTQDSNNPEGGAADPSAELIGLVSSLGYNLTTVEKSDRPSVEVSVSDFRAFMKSLRMTEALAFDMLLAHTAVDRPSQDIIEVVYQLYSTRHRRHLMVLVWLPRSQPVVPTVSDLWAIAQWQEREVYDLFGVLYAGHPDLRRLFLEDDWVGFPLRKDYKDDFMLERPW